MTGRIFTGCRFLLAATIAVGSFTSTAQAQSAPAQTQSSGESKFVLDLGVGLDKSINGNVNSGAIGRLNGQAAAILPQPYGDVYGTGLTFKFGGGYVLKPDSEIRAVFTLQSADANLVRLGDLGPSSLYGQYSDYVSFGLDLGFRKYVPLSNTKFRVYGEGTLGLAFIDEINVVLSAPQSNLILDETDFYDRTAAFTWRRCRHRGRGRCGRRKPRIPRCPRSIHARDSSTLTQKPRSGRRLRRRQSDDGRRTTHARRPWCAGGSRRFRRDPRCLRYRFGQCVRRRPGSQLVRQAPWVR